MREILVKKILKDINFEEFIGTDYEKDFSLKTIKKKELKPLYGKKCEDAFYMVEGSIKIIFH